MGQAIGGSDAGWVAPSSFHQRENRFRDLGDDFGQGGSCRDRPCRADSGGVWFVRNNSSAGKSHPATTTTLGSPTTKSPVSTPTSASIPPTSATSATSPPQNLQATTADKAALVASFVAFTHDPASDIAGTEPGSVYYAYMPTTRTYWAFARFLPSPSASQRTLVSLQDGGNIGIFREQAGGGWVMLGEGGEPFCPTKSAFPTPVQALWGLTDPPACN